MPATLVLSGVRSPRTYASSVTCSACPPSQAFQSRVTVTMIATASNNTISGVTYLSQGHLGDGGAAACSDVDPAPPPAPPLALDVAPADPVEWPGFPGGDPVLGAEAALMTNLLENTRQCVTPAPITCDWSPAIRYSRLRPRTRQGRRFFACHILTRPIHFIATYRQLAQPQLCSGRLLRFDFVAGVHVNPRQDTARARHLLAANRLLSSRCI